MAERDATRAQSLDDEVLASLHRLLKIVGPVGLLNVSDTIVPVVSLGDVVQRTITVAQPAFLPANIFTALNTASAAGTVQADTGALPEGTYDCQIMVSADNTGDLTWNFQHRNAANTASLVEWNHRTQGGGNTPPFLQVFAVEIALNERLRVVNNQALAAGEIAASAIFARIRL